MAEEANGGPGSSDGRRAELIEAAQAQWVAALTDLGGRNTLLYYKDRRAGTLDLAEVPGFEIVDRVVIGTFTYAKLPMVRDMQAAGELLADSDVVAATAGDPEAQDLLSADDGTEPVLDSPAEDYSVLDADSSQRSAIAAVLSGRSVVVHGPPGTGKSQTIANLERVQGDERDAIILSIGYGKHPDGRMRYQWGPLLRDGGERRLNVAATRAKHRLTLVSSFSSHDVDPDRVTKAGARLLADYLEYAGSGGTAVGASGGAELNPFEADVRDKLAACGITVVPQYGVGGYRVDFAATHPDDADRMVLAIEADGASYRESGSVRDRDRLRGEHLQRLGWHFHRVWSTNWFHDPQGEVAKLQEAYQRAVSAAGPPPVPDDPPAAVPDRPPSAVPDHPPSAATGTQAAASGPPRADQLVRDTP